MAAKVRRWANGLFAALAALALAAALLTLASTAANARALRAAQDRLRAYDRDQDQVMANALSALDAAHGPLRIDTRPATTSDWPRLARRVMPSVVALSGLEKPKGHGENSRAWLIPGVRGTRATAMLSRLYAWFQGWPDADRQRHWRVICAGFVAGDGRQVLTAAHCVKNEEAVRARTAAGEWRTARVVGLDVSRDVAVLRIAGRPLPSLTVAPMMPRQGAAVMTAGAPAGYGFAVGTGIVARYGRDGSYLAPDEFMLVTATITGGNSGGVVVNARGEAVAMVSYGPEHYTQTIPIGRVRAVARRLEAVGSEAYQAML